MTHVTRSEAIDLAVKRHAGKGLLEWSKLMLSGEIFERRLQYTLNSIRAHYHAICQEGSPDNG